jgi:phosphate transport system substrate-binding protein
MSYGITMGNARIKMIVGAVALAVAGVSHAATTLVGGGATLPALGYAGSTAATQKQVTAGATGSLFGAYTASVRGNPTVSYCSTGSGAGKNILALVSGTSVQDACPNTGTINGFGAPAVSRTDLAQPNFAAADSPLAQSDFSNYTTNHVSGDFPTQFPAVAGAIAIAFNKTDDQGTVLASSAVNLTDAEVCSVFSGNTTTWNALQALGGITLPSGHTISGPINVQFRSDGSGTTFGFSNHLANVCSGTASAHFVTSQAFTGPAGTTPPTVESVNFPSGVPSNWTGSSGNPAVVTAIQAADGNLGYVEAANAISSGVAFANVNGLNPKTNLGSSTTHLVTVSSSNIVFNEAITGADATTGHATFAAITGAPTTQCIALVQPDSYATQPTGQYPIVAISYLLGNAKGNGTDLAHTQLLLGAPYNSTVTGSVTSIGANTGLAFLSSPITSSQVSACLVN